MYKHNSILLPSMAEEVNSTLEYFNWRFYLIFNHVPNIRYSLYEALLTVFFAYIQLKINCTEW